MTLLKSLILGIVQGLTEFLPVSSSGHLVIFANILGVENQELLFDIVLHLGTLLAIFVYFRKDLLALIVSIYKLVFSKNQLQESNHKDYNFIKLILIALIPSVILGFVFKDFFNYAFSSTLHVGLGLLLTSVLLYSTKFIKHGKRSIADMTILDAFIIGMFQGIAITPGVSRSGSTFFSGYSRGIEDKSVLKFSFFLFIPTMIGATMLEVYSLVKAVEVITQIPFIYHILGFSSAFFSGMLAIKILDRVFRNRKFYMFSYYVFTVAIIVIVTSMS